MQFNRQQVITWKVFLWLSEMLNEAKRPKQRSDIRERGRRRMLKYQDCIIRSSDSIIL